MKQTENYILDALCNPIFHKDFRILSKLTQKHNQLKQKTPNKTQVGFHKPDSGMFSDTKAIFLFPHLSEEINILPLIFILAFNN